MKKIRINPLRKHATQLGKPKSGQLTKNINAKVRKLRKGR